VYSGKVIDFGRMNVVIVISSEMTIILFVISLIILLRLEMVALYNLVLKLLETILPLLLNFFKITVRAIIMSNFVTLRE
tara:strand:+ start:3172 stop:3408 length:237 start_codon:yes stop_codon:yes gene_type:complete